MNIKRLIGFIVLASTLPVTFSCSKDENNSPGMESRSIIIRATREGDTPETKTQQVVVGQDSEGNDILKTYWSVADEISVFFGSGTDGGAKFTSTNTEASLSADFSGILNAVTGSSEGVSQKYFWGVYPYSEQNTVTLDGASNYLTTVVPDAQYGTAGSFSEGQNMSVGRSLGLEMSFKNLLSGIKVSFSRSDIVRIEVKGNNNEEIAGKVNVSMDSGEPLVSSIVEGKTSVSLTPIDGGTFLAGPVYRVYFLPTNFTNGLTITFYASDGSVGKRVFGSLNFKRNEPKNAANADSKATFVSPSYVDMGNGLLMATFNVGATSPEEAGNYYAFGETSPKSNYSYDTYKWGTSASDLTKYIFGSWYGGTEDHRYGLEATDDAATVNWGNNWRTPTYDEWSILQDNEGTNYTWTWTDNYNSTGVAGYTVTCNANGNSIFLPAAGQIAGETLETEFANQEFGVYWTSNVYSGACSNGLCFLIVNRENNAHWNVSRSREMGLSVRPIYAPRKRVTGVSIPEAQYTIQEGKWLDFSVTLSPSDAFETGMTWTSDNPNVIASITGGQTAGSSPRAYGRQPGTAKLTVTTTDGGYTASCTVTVTSPATGISLNKNTAYFYGYPEDAAMAPLQLTATVAPSTASQACIWSSSDESVATVSSSGLVTPVGSGKTTIKATKGTYSASCEVTVEYWKHLTGLALSKESLMLGVDAQYTLYPTFTPSDAINKELTWTSSDTGIATVSSEGQVRAKKPGIAEIKATSTDGSLEAKCIVTVVTAFIDGHGYVDMHFGTTGGCLKIAATNVGADNPWDYGDLFQWGDTTPWSYDYKNHHFADKNYKYYGGVENGSTIMTKYNSSDQKNILEPSDDAATVNWSQNWKTPTVLEWTEIMNYFKNSPTTVNGIRGVMLEDKDGAKIFFPTPDRGLPYEANNYQIVYWSSRVTSNELFAHTTYIQNLNDESSTINNTGSASRTSLHFVRPILKTY